MIVSLDPMVWLKAATESSRVETLLMFYAVVRPHHDGRSNSLGTIGSRQRSRRQASAARLGRADDGHQCSSGSNQASDRSRCSPDDIEHQIACRRRLRVSLRGRRNHARRSAAPVGRSAARPVPMT